MEEYQSALNNLQRESRELIHAVMNAMVEAVMSKHIPPVRLSLALVERLAKEQVVNSFPVICLIDALLTASVHKTNPITTTTTTTISINNSKDESNNVSDDKEEVRQRVFAAVLTAFWAHAPAETFTPIHTHSLIRNKTERIVKRWGQRGLLDAACVTKILNAVHTGEVNNETVSSRTTSSTITSSTTVTTGASNKVQEPTPHAASSTVANITHNAIDKNDNWKQGTQSDLHNIHINKTEEDVKETNTLRYEATHANSVNRANTLIDSDSHDENNNNNNSLKEKPNSDNNISGDVLWSETEAKELIALLKSCHGNLERLPSSISAPLAEEINAQLTSAPSLRALHFLRVAAEQLQHETDKFASQNDTTQSHLHNTYNTNNATNSASFVNEQHHLESTHKSNTKESLSELLHRLHSPSTLSASSHQSLTGIVKNNSIQRESQLHYSGKQYIPDVNYNAHINTSVSSTVSCDDHHDSNRVNKFVSPASKSVFPRLISNTSEECSLAHRSGCGELLTYRDLYKWQALRDKLEHDMKLKEEIEKSDIVTQMQHWREIKLQERLKKEQALLEGKNMKSEVRVDSSNSSTSAGPVPAHYNKNNNNYNNNNHYNNRNNYHYYRGRDNNRRRRWRHMYRNNNYTTHQQFGGRNNNYSNNRQADNSITISNNNTNNVYESNDIDEKCTEKSNNNDDDETCTTNYYVDHFPRVITSSTPARRPFRIPPSRQIQQSEFVRLPFPSESAWIQTVDMDELALFASKAEMSKYKTHK